MSAPTLVLCPHLPTPHNRFCGDCGDLVVAHDLRFDAAGHALQVLPGSATPVWCWRCEVFA